MYSNSVLTGHKNMLQYRLCYTRTLALQNRKIENNKWLEICKLSEINLLVPVITDKYT